MSSENLFAAIRRNHDKARIDAIYALRGERPASQIAIDYGISRNSVIGIWHREMRRRGEAPMRKIAREPLTLEEREQRRLRELRSKAEYRRRRREESPHYCAGPRLVYSRSEPVPPVTTTPANNGAGKAFIDLGSGECRWPLGELLDQPTAFCGATVAHDRCSYCEGHRRMSIGKPARNHFHDGFVRYVAIGDNPPQKFDVVEGLTA